MRSRIFGVLYLAVVAVAMIGWVWMLFEGLIRTLA
jgi:hypothetical protein